MNHIADNGTPKPSLYQRLIDAGIEVSNWQSDLLFEVTEQSAAIVKACLYDGTLRCRPTVFISNDTSKPTYDAAFQYDPYWSGLQRKVAA